MTCSMHQSPSSSLVREIFRSIPSELQGWEMDSTSLFLPAGQRCPAQHSSPEGWLDCSEGALWCRGCPWPCHPASATGAVPAPGAAPSEREGRSRSVRHGFLAIRFIFHSISPHSQGFPHGHAPPYHIPIRRWGRTQAQPLSLSLCREHRRERRVPPAEPGQE